MDSRAVSFFLALGLLATGACGAEDPLGPGGACVGMGANCAGAATCCSPLVCVAGRVCGVDSTGTVDSGTAALGDAGASTGDSGTVSACADRGDSCVASSCCSGLVCIAGRLCGDPPSDGGVSTTDGGVSTTDGGVPPTGDGGTGGVDSGGAGGLCANELSPCDVMPCCMGLVCNAGDFGMTCADPMGGGGGM